MSWEISLHVDVERWYLDLCRDDPTTADGIADAIEQLAMVGPALGGPWWTGSMGAATTT